jgi:integrase
VRIQVASIRRRSETAYQIIVSNGYDVNGKKLTKTKTVTLDPKLSLAKAEKELQRQAALFEEEVKKGIVLDGGKITFAEFIDKWLHDYAEKQLAPKTLHRYKSLLDRIVPALGHLKMDKLQPNHLLQFYNNLSEEDIRQDNKYIALPELSEIIKQSGKDKKDIADAAGINVRTLMSILTGNPTTEAEVICEALNLKLSSTFKLKGKPKPLSDTTILHHHRLISSILTCAVQWQVIFSNPAERVKPPKVEKKEAEHYDEDQTEKMLVLLENEPIKYRTMIVLTVFAGLRRGELCGLEWPDVSFDNSLLRVRQASQYIPGQGTFAKDTKNDSSYRIISLPSVAIKMLKEYKVWQNEHRLECGDQWIREWDEHPRLFTQVNGKPIFPDTITSWFLKFRKKYDLPELPVHGLRHTNATLLIRQGVDIQTVSRRLGHARTSTTTDIYAHALRRPDQEAAEKLDKLFQKDNKQEKPKVK